MLFLADGYTKPTNQSWNLLPTNCWGYSWYLRSWWEWKIRPELRTCPSSYLWYGIFFTYLRPFRPIPFPDSQWLMNFLMNVWIINLDHTDHNKWSLIQWPWIPKPSSKLLAQLKSKGDPKTMKNRTGRIRLKDIGEKRS